MPAGLWNFSTGILFVALDVRISENNPSICRVCHFHNEVFTCCLLYAGFFLGPFFNIEDGGDMFLLHVS
jgi:hypothetical protein